MGRAMESRSCNNPELRNTGSNEMSDWRSMPKIEKSNYYPIKLQFLLQIDNEIVQS